MPLIKDDDMIEQIPAATANEALRHSVLPWTAEAGPLRLDAETPDCADNFVIEVGAAIEDQVLRNPIEGKCFAELLRDPCARRMLGHVAAQNPSSVVGDHKEAVDYPERQRGHREKVHRSNSFTMIG